MSLYGLPADQLLNSSALAAEVVSILVGSIGLVVAIPLTTAVAVLLVGSKRPIELHPAA
jgi:uncharacterized membrane protein